jgi:hypothetical protein
MFAYIAHEASATAYAKQRKPLSRSDELVEVLRGNGKLVDDVTFNSVDCSTQQP